MTVGAVHGCSQSGSAAMAGGSACPEGTACSGSTGGAALTCSRAAWLEDLSISSTLGQGMCRMWHPSRGREERWVRALSPESSP